MRQGLLHDCWQWWRAGVCSALLLAGIGSAALAQESDFDAPPSGAKPEPPQRVAQALEESADFHFIERPLKDVLEELGRELNVPYRIDWRRLDAAGILQDTPVTFQAKKISYRSALRLMLRPIELTFVEDDEELLVTTPQAAEIVARPKVYDVVDLIDVSDAASPRGKRALRELKELLQAWVAPASWDEVGGPNTIEIGPRGLLAISAPSEFHPELSSALAQFRQARREFAKGPWRTREKMRLPDLPADPLEKALARISAYDFERARLEDVVSILSDEAGPNVNILLDLPRLKELKVDGETQVTLRGHGRSVRKSLEAIAEQLELAIVLQNEVVELRPADSGCEPASPRLYLIDDLTGPFSREEQWLDPTERAEQWQRLIARTIRPQSWNTVGGPNEVRFLHHPPALLISAEASTHREIAQLLAEMRQATPPRQGEPPSAAELDAAYAQRLITRRFVLFRHPPATPSPSGEPELPPRRELPEPDAIMRVIRKQVGQESTWGDAASYLDHVGATILVRARPAIVEQIADLLKEQSWLQPEW
jgi:hypothetical protein